MRDLNVKKDFPIFKHHPKLVFLDNAATTQKPAVAIDAAKEFYETAYANIHRATYDLASKATELFEGTRTHIASFISAGTADEIIFTRNASESINLAAYIEGQTIQAGDEMLVSVAGHHSNILPWMRLAKAKGATVIWVDIAPDGRLDVAGLKDKLSAKTKVVAIEHVSNVLGYVNPVQDIIRSAHRVGAHVLVDAAQSSCRLPIDVRALDADYVAFSGHKMYGPTGVGFLYGKRELLASAQPMLSGGGTIKRVTKEEIEWADSPFKFEAGTPDIAGVVAFNHTLTYLEKIGMDAVWQHDQYLARYALEKIVDVPGIKIYGPLDGRDRSAVFSFSFVNQGKIIHSHDVAEICNQFAVAMRGGHHCAQPLMQELGVKELNRVSFGMYNTKEDVDALVQALTHVHDVFNR